MKRGRRTQVKKTIIFLLSVNNNIMTIHENVVAMFQLKAMD